MAIFKGVISGTDYKQGCDVGVINPKPQGQSPREIEQRESDAHKAYRLSKGE